MSLVKRATLGASLVAFALIAAPALATPAVLLGTEAFLSGPGGDYDRLGSLDKGDHVDVIWCGAKGNWCLVEIHGKKGWIPLAALNTRPGGGGSTADGGSSSSGGGGGTGKGSASKEAAAIATEKAPGGGGGGGGAHLVPQGSGITYTGGNNAINGGADIATLKPKP